MKQDSIVPLKLPIAKLVIKDLISGDGAKSELVEANKVIDLQKGQIGLYVQKDSLKEQKINNLQGMFDKATQQRDLAIEMSKSLEKELKAQKLKTKFYKIGSTLGIGLSVIMTGLFLAK